MPRFAPTAVLTALLAVAPAFAQPPGEWAMLGGTPARNMAHPRETLSRLPAGGPDWADAAAGKTWAGEWLKWSADLGSWNETQPVVAGGKVFVGTNNGRPRNPRDRGRPTEEEPAGRPLDKHVLMCFDAATGAFRWQAVHDRKNYGSTIPPFNHGLASAPAVAGDRLYYVTDVGCVVCLDVNGFADGNQGIQTETRKAATDADVVWEFDMARRLDVSPGECLPPGARPLVVGDWLFVPTGNGVDESFAGVPKPDAPGLVCLNRETGKLVWAARTPGNDIMHGEWGSPVYAADPVPQVIFPGGDGWLRAYDPPTGKLLWAFDGNPKGAAHEAYGKGRKNHFVAAPVVHGGRVFIGTGHSPHLSAGEADLWCIDLKKAVGRAAGNDRDVSPDLLVAIEKPPNEDRRVITRPNPASALTWRYGGRDDRPWLRSPFLFGRTTSTVCVVDGVVYAAELEGYLHCLDAGTGRHFWRCDVDSAVWGSPYFVDGKVLLGTEDGDVFVFRHTTDQTVIDESQAVSDAGAAAHRKALAAGQDAAEAELAARRASYKARPAMSAPVAAKYLLGRFELGQPIRGTPAVAGGVLYVAGEQTLFAVGKP